MKSNNNILRESGMPEKDHWESFFNATEILKKFALDSINGPILDFACGYGTFTIPLAILNKNHIYCLDINSDYLKLLQKEAQKNKITNIMIFNHNILTEEFVFPERVLAVLLFNILHCEHPKIIIKKLAQYLKPDAKFFVIHWRSDIDTPRGPSLEIRPKPEDIIALMESLGFEKDLYFKEISKYHYGISFKRRKKS